MRSRVPAFRRTRLRLAAAVPAVASALLLGACRDEIAPSNPRSAPDLSAAVAPATLRTERGDLITGDPAAFAQALKEIGPGGKVLVWIKDTSTPRPSAQFFLDLPSSGRETIALPADVPGAARRNTLGPDKVRGASMDAVIHALEHSGVASVERMDALPLLIVRLEEPARLGALNALLRHPNVDYVSAVRARPVRLQAAPVGSNPIDTKHTVHKIPQAWDLTRGSGAVIGILDSGLARSTYTGAFHDDGQYFGSYGVIARGFIDDLCGSANSGACSPYDDNIHGTAMVGLVASNDNGIGYVGIAPFATTYSMKIAWNTHISGHCDDDIFGNSSYCLEDDDFARAVNYAAARRFSVLSMSFSGSFNSDVYRALSTARNTYGVFLVAATGNTVGASAVEPASYDVVMGIAGVDAAGNNVYSTAARDVSGFAGGATMGATCYQQYTCDAGSPSIYTETGGTSAATANVAGIVGLIRSYYPNETVSQVWERLVNTAEGPNRVVNAYAALTYQRPLAVGISGPSSVAPGDYAYWAATTTGGQPPFTYTWYRDGQVVGTGPSYSGYADFSAFQLQVVATDASGATSTGYLWVMVTDPNQCPTDPRQIRQEICAVQ
ncbi:S8 family peptidase [Longimicrobium sp.]|uniref:S8 family peptidase n=1 Tax=Longimicrobium sp. TaxID=2029185 RepID=UPI002B758C93|nr:S8 family serine peptidase [Longimicrobium sp.]HSU14368.1 S8 family serine peptidase [Longimicrobium sp.]